MSLVVPDMGEFLAMLSISNYKWKDVATVVLKEIFDRNSLWILKKFPQLQKVSSEEIDKERLSNTWMASRTSLRLVMFQGTADDKNIHFIIT